MEDYQNRVMIERMDLQVKTDKLRKFVEARDFSAAVPDYRERERLRNQLEVMEKYLSILNERIGAFK